MTGIRVKLTTSSGRLVRTADTGSGGVYRLAVRPGLYRVSAYLAAKESRACDTKTVRVRKDERKIINLSCSIP
jgi:hypothetical protein